MNTEPTPPSFAAETKRTIHFILSELRPKGKLLTVFNILSVPTMLLGAVLLVVRFTKGLGAITNLSNDFPWGLWIGFDVITGVAFAGGAYVLTFMVYILKIDMYRPIVRVTVLNGFLAYVFYAGALLLDLGRPWNVINPIIGNSFGLSSVLFLVAWHFLLYMIAALLEFSPAVAEWLGWRRMRKILGALTLGAVIFGVTLSVLHQSGLGALFLMAKGKIHPLWYSELIPILFFVSSIFAGLSLVIVEGSISHRVFSEQISRRLHSSYEEIVIGLARVCAGTMFVYAFLEALVFVHNSHYGLINTPMGYWYLTEMLGFLLIPLMFFVHGVRHGHLPIIRIGAILTLIGVLLNRLNISIIAFKWYEATRYYPSWMEIEVTLAILFAEIWAFRWIVNRMPVLRDSPTWVVRQGESKATTVQA